MKRNPHRIARNFWDVLPALLSPDACIDTPPTEECLSEAEIARIAEEWNPSPQPSPQRRGEGVKRAIGAVERTEHHLRRCARCRALLLSARELVLRQRRPDAREPVDVDITPLWSPVASVEPDAPLKFAAAGPGMQPRWLLRNVAALRVLATVDSRDRLIACVECEGQPITGARVTLARYDADGRRAILRSASTDIHGEAVLTDFPDLPPPKARDEYRITIASRETKTRRR